MPTYEYECPVHGIFEEFHSMSEKIENCPMCEKDGKVQPVKRLISLSGKGVVVLTGQDLAAQIKSDANKLAQTANSNERVLADIVGHDKYHQLQLNEDKKARNRR